MPRYKRTRDDAELDLPVEAQVAPEDLETLTKLRNMWEFASLMQYIFLFGHVVKIDDDFDIEDLEAECLKPTPSERLAQIGLQFLKYVSSHRGLTPEIFDEYTRRQYVAKAPQRNPFGEDEDPIKFNDMSIYTRIQILQQLSVWTFGNVDRIRGMMPEDEDDLNWRMEPLGWDKDDRAYFVLDDNRLYRRSDEPLPPPSLVQKKSKPKPKPKSKAAKKDVRPRTRGTRSSKRQKVEESEEEEEPEEEQEMEQTAVDDTVMTNADDLDVEPGYGFTSKTWELIAITLEEYQEFLATIFRSRDPNEKRLRARIEEDVLPIIEKRAEAVRQKQLKKLRELENEQKMATAKRSSRLAGKAEREAQERAEREAEEKKIADLKMAREEQERQKRIEEGHESRRLTREQRLREREAKRILHEEELAKLEEDAERAGSQGPDGDSIAESKRISERQRVTQKEQHKKELEKLAEEEGNWFFDCSVCGVHGENLDDGTHSVACDRCNVWQHSKCHGFTAKQAEKEDFSFICATCRRKEEDAKKPKIPPLKLTNRGSGSPEMQKAANRPVSNGQQASRLPDHVSKQLDALHSSHDPRASAGPFGATTYGASSMPQQAQASGHGYPPIGNFAPRPSPSHSQGGHPPQPRRPSSGHSSSPVAVPNGYVPTHHQQQHQYAHSSAVASAGGHPPYHQQQQYAPPKRQPQQGQYAHAGPHPSTYPAGGQYYYPPQPQPPPQYSQGPHYQQQQYYPQQYQQPQPAPPAQRRGSGQLMNGFQSPSKQTPKPASSSPPQPSVQPYATPQAYGQAPPRTQYQPPLQQQPPKLQQSPKTTLPPPVNANHQAPSHSPVKSSPPPAAQHSTQRSPRPISHLTQPPQSLHFPPSNGHHAGQPQSGQVHTPQMRPTSAGDAKHASQVVADGMSGPWPANAKAIPQKHDQSPAPPSSAHSLNERTILPPATPLAPSPSQQAAGAVGTVPVKKMQELSPKLGADLNGAPSVQPSAKAQLPRPSPHAQPPPG
ncbi:hypothetical protein TI39_contig5867g00004 [Zymoseptoria brevis]|uniref:PHD-type domain-containing protein n=1 Tax=Zymoseptoria brevis TaxID=1047168 RepID=A0A0F4G7U7_9PEZI|nr:hypothetical protein TI39_contig5867g00004 [Zymoseptoria brevis]